MTMDQLIEQYRKRILHAKNKKNETSQIIDEITNLVYEKDNSPISNEDKIKILQGIRIYDILEHSEIFAQDNKEHLELIDQALKMLGGK